MAELAETSPYVYMATAFFAMSSLFSDLLCLRAMLSCGFLGLVLAGLSGYSADGSFENIPLSEGIVDITMFINMVLCALNLFIFGRLVGDEVLQGKIQDEDELALFRFFRSRNGLTQLEFQHIYKHGTFLELEPGEPIPDCHRTLYLVVEGKAVANCCFNGKRTPSFVKRSGEFFDVKLFNVLSLPVGFDNTDFQATAKTHIKLFAWDVNALVAMRQLQSPSLVKFWEHIVLRSLCAAAVRHHLKLNDTLYDSLLIPEDQAWLDGARSRDFAARGPEPTRLERLLAQFRILFVQSIHPIPPHGIRHRPGYTDPNPKQQELEALCRGEMARSLFDRRAAKEMELLHDDSQATGGSWKEEV